MAGYIELKPHREPPKYVWLKRLAYRLHLRTQYPIKLSGGYWGNIIRTDLVSYDVRPNLPTTKEEKESV
jgi:hypothetical protein